MFLRVVSRVVSRGRITSRRRGPAALGAITNVLLEAIPFGFRRVFVFLTRVLVVASWPPVLVLGRAGRSRPRRSRILRTATIVTIRARAFPPPLTRPAAGVFRGVTRLE